MFDNNFEQLFTYNLVLDYNILLKRNKIRFTYSAAFVVFPPNNVQEKW